MPFNNLKRFAFFSILLLASAVVFSAQGSVNGSGATYSTPIEIIPVYSAFIPEKTGVIGQSGLGANQSIVRDANSAYSLASVISTPSPQQSQMQMANQAILAILDSWLPAQKQPMLKNQP